MDMPDIDLLPLLRNFLKLLTALVITFPVAWNRERRSRSVGLRTFPLVAMSSCAFVLVAADVVGLDQQDAQARIIQGLMTGIGFVGGGAILKNDDSVKGTATAASIWGTGVIGAAVAYERYEIAVVVSFLIYALLRVLEPIKAQLRDEEDDGDGG